MFKQSSKEYEESVTIPSPVHHKKVRNMIISLKFFPLKETTVVSQK
jgi:hypothetical protein